MLKKHIKLVLVMVMSLFIALGATSPDVYAKTTTKTKKVYYSKSKKAKYIYKNKKNGRKKISSKRYTYNKKGKKIALKSTTYKKNKVYMVTYYKYKGKKAIKTSRRYYYDTFTKSKKPTKKIFAKRTYKTNGKTTKKVYYYTKAGKRKALAAKAKTAVGRRYRYGGTTTSGFDCSGLTSYVYKQTLSKSIGRTTYSQTKKGKYVKVSSKALQPGDLLFWGSKSSPYHVGIYVGSGKYVHASTPSTGVRYEKLSTYKPAYAKRVI